METMKYSGLFKGSLSRQLLAGFGLSLITVGAATLGINYLLIRSDLEDQVEQRAQSITQGLVFATEGAIEVGYDSILRRVVQNYSTFPAVEEIAVVRPNGETLANSEELTPTRNRPYRLIRPELATAMDEAANSSDEISLRKTIDNKKFWYKYFPLAVFCLEPQNVGV